MKAWQRDKMRGYEYTAEQAYKLSVRPLGIFLIVGGVLAGLAGLLFPADRILVGAVQPEIVKRTFMVAAGLFNVAVGYGLIRKIRVAWYTLLLAPWIGLVVMLLTESSSEADHLWAVVFCAMFSVIMSVGLYYVTKPAFQARNAICRTETVRSDNIRWLLALGRWVVLATHIWICLFLMGIVTLAAYLIGTGGVRLQLPEPWDSLLFYAVFTPHIAVAICWGLFSLVFLILYRRILGGGVIRQIASLVAVAVPFWGVRYYDRVTKRLIEKPREEVR